MFTFGTRRRGACIINNTPDPTEISVDVSSVDTVYGYNNCYININQEKNFIKVSFDNSIEGSNWTTFCAELIEVMKVNFTNWDYYPVFGAFHGYFWKDKNNADSYYDYSFIIRNFGSDWYYPDSQNPAQFLEQQTNFGQASANWYICGIFTISHYLTNVGATKLPRIEIMQKNILRGVATIGEVSKETKKEVITSEVGFIDAQKQQYFGNNNTKWWPMGVTNNGVYVSVPDMTFGNFMPQYQLYVQELIVSYSDFLTKKE